MMISDSSRTQKI